MGQNLNEKGHKIIDTFDFEQFYFDQLYSYLFWDIVFKHLERSYPIS